MISDQGSKSQTSNQTKKADLRLSCVLLHMLATRDWRNILSAVWTHKNVQYIPLVEALEIFS